MESKILVTIHKLARDRGKAIVITAILLSVISAIFIPRLKISSSYQELISPHHPEQKKYAAFQKEFGASDNIIIVMEGNTEKLKKAAVIFANKLKDDPVWIKSVFYKSDSELILKNLPLYLPYPRLQETEKTIQQNARYLSVLPGINNIPSLIAIAGPLMAGGGSFDEKLALEGIRVVDSFLADWQAHAEGKGKEKICVLEYLSGGAEQFISLVKGEGFLFSRDYTMLFLFAQPSQSRDGIDYLRPLMDAVKGTEKKIREENPDLMKSIRISYTGMPVHVLTETETVYSDVGRLGMVSVVLVAIILLVGFRSLKKMILGVFPLLLGILITLGLFSVTVGTLNIISSSFLAVLFGIGIDFGIYFIRRTEEELGNGLTNDEAVRRSVVITGKGILTGGFTTGLAFFAIMLSDFAGYTQLGLTAGIGIFIVLTITFLVMPSLLLLFPIEPRSIASEKTTLFNRMTSGKKGGSVFTALLVLSLGFGIFASTRLTMDYNVLKLLPVNTESTIFQLKMEEKSDFNMSVATVTDKSLEGITAKVEKLRKLKSVSRVDSISDLIPEEQDKKLEIISRLKPAFGQVQIHYVPWLVSPENLEEQLDTLSEQFEIAQEKAFAGGMGNVEKALDSVIKRIDAIRSALKKNPVQAVAGTGAFEKEIFSILTSASAGVQSWTRITKIGIDDIPPALKNRFKSSQGTYVAYVNASESIWNVEFLDRFVKEITGISENATGFPVTHKYFVIEAGMAAIKSVIFAIIPVIFILLIDFRRIDATLLSLIPLGIGILWLQGVLFLAGQTYNVANVAGLPLLLGLGVVYGVHIVHRWLERPELSAFTATQTTGRGVAFSALTTIVGLFSIVFARHGGVSSFGLVLMIGISLCLITALFVLPFIIDAYKQYRR